MVIDFRNFKYRRNFQGVRTYRMSLLITFHPLQYLSAAFLFSSCFISNYPVYTKQFTVMIRRLCLSLSEFRSYPAIVKAETARIRVGVSQLTSSAELMRHPVCGERFAAKNHHPTSIECIFKFLYVLAKRGSVPLYVMPVFGGLWAVPDIGMG